jgi:hypothetical protein
MSKKPRNKNFDLIYSEEFGYRNISKTPGLLKVYGTINLLTPYHNNLKVIKITISNIPTTKE